MKELGLKSSEIAKILDCLKHLDGMDHLYLFGSPAMGNHKMASDVDLCITTKMIDHNLVSRVRYLLNEELDLPYFFDVIDYNSITSQELIKHIDEFGIDLLAY
ncbi:nucleotidyltransferase domain-containing protein [Ancylomarina euxinus]|uniref:Nucleotidyltransferase domain-containing protein n=1 Tax=Ancylomarina euxinus TaxID=2283627 RepID=A0A425XWQ0_9BACT|nr:nucleotidyltransferase domain-containing protein [Ancylomarina euxinus]MCZ4696354.1 nucleotidyltransferase domain-containing protein [Ancylomarina euxinus]MUP16745.1 nucleotidyltransferase domain-containing protein [Ancylomarina euxinus]RRG19065.1 nucleotidyltransferase domain-containing protein [Ancylomarina euxinus]